MEYIVPAVLFAVGLVAFLFASSSSIWRGSGRSQGRLSTREGAVRLDLLGRATEGTRPPTSRDEGSR